jgi:hypothetical protein
MNNHEVRVTLGEHAKTLISRTWAPALLFLAFLTTITVGGDAIQKLTENMPDRIGAFISHAIDIGALLSAAFLINRVVDMAIWEMLVARAPISKYQNCSVSCQP